MVNFSFSSGTKIKSLQGRKFHYFVLRLQKNHYVALPHCGDCWIWIFYLLNIYKIRIVEIAGYGLFTNFPCITAFIVFGNSQGLPLAGYWLEKIARWVSNIPEEIRESHLIGQGSDAAQLEDGAWWSPWNDVVHILCILCLMQ
ncbi:hypothetical protein P3L10_000976 [Capsicum annuum]